MSFDLAQAIAAASPGAVISIPAGTHAANVVIDKPLTLMGQGLAVLDGRKRGPVLSVVADVKVKLAGLLLVGGAAEEGGGGLCQLDGEVEALGCTFRFHQAPQYGGGGAYVRGVSARFTACRFEGNTGRQGAGLLVDGTAQVTVRDCAFIQNAAVEGGALTVRDGARVHLLGCTLADNKVVGEGARGGAVALAGTSSRAPSVTLSHCIVSERKAGPPVLFNGATFPGTLTVERTLVPAWAPVQGNPAGDPAWVGAGQEPYLLTPQSPAVGAGLLSAFGPNAKDLLGRDRAVGEAVDLGAFALVR